MPALWLFPPRVPTADLPLVIPAYFHSSFNPGETPEVLHHGGLLKSLLSVLLCMGELCFLEFPMGYSEYFHVAVQ